MLLEIGFLFLIHIAIQPLMLYKGIGILSPLLPQIAYIDYSLLNILDGRLIIAISRSADGIQKYIHICSTISFNDSLFINVSLFRDMLMSNVYDRHMKNLLGINFSILSFRVHDFTIAIVDSIEHGIVIGIFLTAISAEFLVQLDVVQSKDSHAILILREVLVVID